MALPPVYNTIAEGLYSPVDDVASHSKALPMCDTEIAEFFRDIDKDRSGTITFDELADKLAEIYEDLAPEIEHKLIRNAPRRRLMSDHYLPIYEEAEVGKHPEKEGLRLFLSSMLPDNEGALTEEEFVKHVRSWNVPSQTHNVVPPAKSLLKGTKIHWWRKVGAWASVHGPRVVFLAFVVLLIGSLGLWQLILFYNKKASRNALGNVVILTRFTVGALWPVCFLFLLSMSRLFGSFIRRFYWLSRFINYDRSESFHVRVAWLGLALATTHSVGHLSGTLVAGSDPTRHIAVNTLLHLGDKQMTYMDFVMLVPGWSGLAGLLLFWIIALLSLPKVRRWSYETFQLAHLLMYPWIFFMCIHGTMKLIAYPLMGLWILFPTLLIIFERGRRFLRGFSHYTAYLKTLDRGAITITIKHPRGDAWPNYHAGQYVLLQVPEIAFWQWHPITISSCVGDELQLIIKTEGNWSAQVRELARSRLQVISVGLDGPFGAPTQRFYEFDRSLIIGSGVGVTPFSAILTDMELNLVQERDPWTESRHNMHYKSHNDSPRTDREYRKFLISKRDEDASWRASPFTPAFSPWSSPMPRGSPLHSHSRQSSKISRSPSWQDSWKDMKPPMHGRHASAGSASWRDYDYTHKPHRDMTSPPLPPPPPPPKGGGSSSRLHLVKHSARSDSKLQRASTFTQHTRQDDLIPSRRRVDFHWMVRERNSLRWLASLLNRVHDLSGSLDRETLELNVTTHITAPKKNISEYVFRYLLDAYRTKTSNVSALTGLKARSNFGRPDLVRILNDYYRDEVQRMKLEGTWGRGQKVGVFFCGNPNIGRLLADTCAELTRAGRVDGSRVRFVFMMEVFS